MAVLSNSGLARGARGPCSPKLLVNGLFPINLRCYVILVCKWSLDGANFIVPWWSLDGGTVLVQQWSLDGTAISMQEWSHRWRYCLNAVMITRWQYCLTAAMITRWHHFIGVEMVTGWVHWIVNVFTCKKLWSARRKHQHLQTAGKDH